MANATMPNWLHNSFKAKGSEVKILIGGAPVTQEYAVEIGADGYAGDANQAVAAVEKVLA